MSRVWYSLYDRLLHRHMLTEAFRKVKAANGAPGIDGQSCKAFAKDLDCNISKLLHELSAKIYQPQPVKRVEIDKPDGGIRMIGIPTVRDRVVQQALRNILEPISTPGFIHRVMGIAQSGEHTMLLPRQRLSCVNTA